MFTIFSAQQLPERCTITQNAWKNLCNPVPEIEAQAIRRHVLDKGSIFYTK
jgi:hypothetical protein